MVWIVVAVAALALLLLVMARKKRLPDAEPIYSYKKLPALFTPAERSFLGVLEQAVGRNLRVFGKVRVADVLAPRDGLDKPAWQSAFDKIDDQHFDFVLCSPENLCVLCVIELDDKSQPPKDRQKRDEFVIGACLAAGVPRISFHVGQDYSASDISAMIADAIVGTTISSPQPVANVAFGGAPPAAPGLAPNLAGAPRCRRCRSPMIMRTAKAGENAGRAFWGCSSFPNCREIVTI